MRRNAVISCGIILVLFTGVQSRVCTRNIATNRSVTVSYTSFDRMCPTCEKRHIVKSRSKEIPYTYTITECCPGYEKKDQTLDPSRENCVASCAAECRNGFCSRQNICNCYQSYEKHNTRNTCVPTCGSGYKSQGENCVPHCNKPCLGGRCVAPEMCSCDAGWNLNESGECVRTDTDPIICNPPCGNGTCMHGIGCSCWHGYEYNENMTPRCVPSCSKCPGTCIAPGRCVCPEDHELIYTTANGQICDCSEDCHTKCFNSSCTRASSTSTTAPYTHTMATTETSRTHPEIYFDVKIFPKIEDPEAETVTPIDGESDDINTTTWIIILTCTTILTVALSILVIWEYMRK